jgi:hypothetical protein
LAAIEHLIVNLPSARLKRLGLKASATLRLHRGALPNFIVIGAQKAGTTSLHAYLSEHPQVLPSATKEIHYFDLNYSKGEGWYRRRFLSLAETARSKRAISGEASPYYLFHPLVPSRIAETVPSAKLIALLRDPVARAYSHYQHNLRKGREQSSFADAIAREMDAGASNEKEILASDAVRNSPHQDFSYLARGRYAEQLERFFARFPREQILILRSEDLFEDPAAALCEVARFLELKELPRRALPVRNAGNYRRSEIPEEGFLRDYFAPHNQRLYALLGRNLEW